MKEVLNLVQREPLKKALHNVLPGILSMELTKQSACDTRTHIDAGEKSLK